jgi:uncharacterized membrane protein
MDDMSTGVLIADGWAHVRSTMRLLLAQEPHVVVVGEAGLLSSSTLVVKSFAMVAAICVMLLAVWAFKGRLEIVPLTIFATVAGVTIWIGTRVYRSMLPVPSGQVARQHNRHRAAGDVSQAASG